MSNLHDRRFMSKVQGLISFATTKHEAQTTGVHGLEDTGWITPTFQNSWVNYGDIWETAAYRRVNGIVYLRGLIKLGTMAQAAFTLPAGFRPDSNKHMASVGGGSFAYARVMSDGRVVPDTGSNSWFSLANISFPADQ